MIKRIKKKEKEKGFLSLRLPHTAGTESVPSNSSVLPQCFSKWAGKRELQKGSLLTMFTRSRETHQDVSEFPTCSLHCSSSRVEDNSWQEDLNIFNVIFLGPQDEKNLGENLFTCLWQRHKQEHFPKVCSINTPEVMMRNVEREKSVWRISCYTDRSSLSVGNKVEALVPKLSPLLLS